MNKRVIFFGFLIIFILIFIVLLSRNNSNDTIKIGLIGPFSGDTAIWGDNVLVGSQIAIDEINLAGGINGKKVELVVEDGRCSVEGGSKAYNLLANNYNLSGVIGPSCSSEASAGLPIGVEKNIPTVLATASAPELTSLGDNIFRVYPSDSYQGEYSAKFIYNTLNKKSVSIIYLNNAWGLGVTEKFKNTFISIGGKINLIESVNSEQKDLKEVVLKIKDTNSEVLFLPVYPNTCIELLKVAKEIDLEIVLFGGDATFSDELLNTGYAENMYFSQPKFSLQKELKEKIIQKKGANFSVNVAAPFGYDATKVLLIAMKNAESLNHEDVIKELNKTSIVGISNPLIEFDKQGDLKNPLFEVRVIKNNEAILYE